MKSLLLELLGYVSTGCSDDAADRVADALGVATDREVRWALDAGLGPFLFDAVGDEAPVHLLDRLKSADLVARVRHGERIDTAIELIDTFSAVGIPVTLLKGISISDQFYRIAHLRPMTDIDLLVPEDAFADAHQQALRLGFKRGPAVMRAGAHHGDPLYRDEKLIKLEIHTALFQKQSRMRLGTTFTSSQIEHHSIPSLFHGRPVQRLSREFQLAYVAAHWTEDLSQHPLHPSHSIALVDSAVILNGAGCFLDWHALFDLLDNEHAIASVLITLQFLQRHELAIIEDRILLELRVKQEVLAAPELYIFQQLIDRYLIRGRPFSHFNSWHLWINLFKSEPRTRKLLLLPWRILSPPTYSHRFNLRAQWARLLHWLFGR